MLKHSLALAAGSLVVVAVGSPASSTPITVTNTAAVATSGGFRSVKRKLTCR